MQFWTIWETDAEYRELGQRVVGVERNEPAAQSIWGLTPSAPRHPIKFDLQL